VKIILSLMVLLSFSNSALAKEIIAEPKETHTVCINSDSVNCVFENKEALQKNFHTPLTLERVIDGDTIVASGKKVRLWGINAPEKKKPFFMAAKMLLESLLNDGQLTCKFIEKDRYNRDVMHCLINGLDVGSMMVQAGMAKDYSKYSGDFYQYEEDLAKSKERGIWSNKVLDEEQTTMCTMEAKVCPDGSYVSRSGHNCEFALCPSER
jgi:endonuclease YncB( thermonuclease family)